MIAGKCLRCGLLAMLFSTINPATLYAKAFGGGLVGVGQCRSTDGGSANLAMNTGVEIGSFNETQYSKHVVFGAEINQGICRFRSSNDALIRLNTLGLLLKAGYGYKSGESMLVTWGVAVGPSQADYTATKDDYDIKSNKTVVGLSVRVGVEAQMSITDEVSAVGGINLLHSELDVTSVKVEPTGSSADKHDYEKALGLNIPEFTVGVRVNL